MSELRLLSVPDFPMVEPGDDVASLIDQATTRAGISLENGDALVIAQKIISKAENRYRKLADVVISEEAREWAAKVDKEPEVVQLILDESVEVVRHRPGVMIVQHRMGYVHANAGIDRSNIPVDDAVLLLPEDANFSAKKIRDYYFKNKGLDVKVIVNDSAGRAWRNGISGFAIGSSGFKPLEDKIGSEDLYGRPLQVTTIAIADEIASAASILMGQGNEACPVVLCRGLALEDDEQQGCEVLIRPKAEDLFR